VAAAQELLRRAQSGSVSTSELRERMLWNALHLLRGEELDDVARKDALNALVLAAALLLILSGILVGVLVWM